MDDASLEEAIAHHQTLLARHTAQLRVLQQQRAHFGFYTPPHIVIELQAAEATIQACHHTIAGLTSQLSPHKRLVGALEQNGFVPDTTYLTLARPAGLEALRPPQWALTRTAIKALFTRGIPRFQFDFVGIKRAPQTTLVYALLAADALVPTGPLVLNTWFTTIIRAKRKHYRLGRDALRGVLCFLYDHEPVAPILLGTTPINVLGGVSIWVIDMHQATLTKRESDVDRTAPRTTEVEALVRKSLAIGA